MANRRDHHGRDFRLPDPPIRLNQIPKPVIVLVATVLIVGVGWLVFCQFFRVNIGPDEAGIVINKFGEDTGEKFAYSWGQKGTMIETMPPGSYFFNSVMRDIKVVKAIDVPAGKAMVLSAKFGGSPPGGQIMAENDRVEDGKFIPGQKGPRPRIYGPGRYRINTPDAFDYEIFDATVITTTGPNVATSVAQSSSSRTTTSRSRARKQSQPSPAPAPQPQPAAAAPAAAFTHAIGVVISKVGDSLPGGQILAEEGQKGILRRVLGPGMYYIHPRMQEVTTVPAVDIAAGYVGVVTQLVGKLLPPDKPLATATDEKGVAGKVLGPGTYYVNPYAAKVDPVDSRYQKVAIEGAGGISFPSTDSFTIVVDLAFEWRYTPGEIPRTFVTLGGMEKVVTNILIPQARSIGRTQGSKHAGRDFIEGEPRQAFQDNFAKEFAGYFQDKGLEIPRVAVKRIVPPTQIAERMRKAVVAMESLLANKEKEQTNRIEAAFTEAQAMVNYVERQVEAETELLVEEIIATADKAKGLVEAETEKQVATLELQAATIEAQITEVLGQADADGDKYVRQAKADGLKLMVDAFQKASAYVSFKFAEAFTPDTKLMMSEDAFLRFLEGLSGTAVR